jgi:50S ribosomal subunit-associated GTPase HflX
MGVIVGKMKEIAMDIESTMLDSSLLLAEAITECGNFELYEETARQVRDRMNTIVNLFEMVRS